MSNKFSWTQEFKRSWETETDNKITHRKIDLKNFNKNKKSIIRHLLVAIDNSAAIEKADYVPTIRSLLVDALPKFVEKFKLLNPLSVINFMTVRNSFDKFVKEFSPTLLNMIGSGDFSLLNCLRSGIELLKDSTYTRELLIITSSINTKDSSSIDTIIKDIKKYSIKVSIISICGEITIFKRIASLTRGLYYVPLNFNDFECVLYRFSEPLDSPDATSSLVPIGFPSIPNNSGICSCHLKFGTSKFNCPSCSTLFCDLPAQCPICELHLVAPMSISQSYYHQYQMNPLLASTEGYCRRCSSDSKYKCNECNSLYCEECRDFVQTELSFCIFCGK